MIRTCVRAAGLAALAALSGCVTVDDPSDSVRHQENLLLLKEDLTRTQGRLETLELEHQRLLRELESLRGAAAEGARAGSPAQARLDALEQRLNAAEAARARDRQAVIDQLSARMAELMAAGKPAPRREAAPASGPAGQRGYEHVVQAGETLSAIAAAYKVKWTAIAEANALASPYRLKAGQTLFVPQP